MANILIDTGFWFGLYDSRDGNYKQANELIDYLTLGQILIPYPTVYETINTRFSKNHIGIQSFENLIKQQNVSFVDDNDYKAKALELTFESAIRLKKPYSLVDMVLRLMLEDMNLKVDYLISFNPKDFYDVCNKRNIKIISE